MSFKKGVLDPDNLHEPLSGAAQRNHYIKCKILGTGIFGSTYLVIDRESDERKECYKVMKQIDNKNVQTSQGNDFRRTIDFMAQLNHESIVKFHECFMDGSHFCVITEYCNNGNLHEALQSHKRRDILVSEKQAIDWLFQLLKALLYLHSKHVLHRNLKVTNIFLKSNKIKLGGFGMAKILMDSTDMASTLVGTPYYTSPEVIKHDKYNYKSDIWSLGCILFEICSLKHAFDGQSLMAVMYKICTGNVPGLPEKYSKNLNSMLSRMLVRDQAERASAKELLWHPLFMSTVEPDCCSDPRRSVEHRGRYVKDKKLGAGSFGTVYLIIDHESSKSRKCYKVLKQVLVGNLEPGEIDSAVKEANLLAQLHHENIVQFYDSFFDGNFFCIVTEYCDGGDMDMTLQSYKKRGASVSEKQVIDWLFELLKAIFYLHSRHVLHRDLKPKNIFLKSNKIKLGDFGIAKMLMGSADMASTFVGTPYYMSPDVIKHDKYNAKSDIWSLGCILFEICSLKHAFDGQGMMEVMHKICMGNVPDLPQKYSKNLNSMFNKMLVRDQAERASAKELLQHPLFSPPSEPNYFKHSYKNLKLKKRFVKDKVIGIGSFGVAYLVVDREGNKNEECLKVMKQIHVEKISSAVGEAEILAQLNHENIVKFHESFMDQDWFCIIIEYCDGGDLDMTLKSYKERNTFVSERQAIDWMIQLLKALFYLHSRSTPILHRDLKLKNIFLKDNTLKVGDFGISKKLLSPSDMAITAVGTPFYVSPEVVTQDRYNDKSDIWSLGCILYEICSLKRAFDGQNHMAVMYKICTGDIPTLPQNYSINLASVLMKMLVRDQHKRASAGELLQLRIFLSPSTVNKPTTASSQTSLSEETLVSEIESTDPEIAIAIAMPSFESSTLSLEARDPNFSDSRHQNVHYSDSEYGELIGQFDNVFSMEESYVSFGSDEDNDETPQNNLAHILMSSKISALRDDGMLKMGEEVFNKAYGYLRDIWSKDLMPSADEYSLVMKKLRDIVKDDSHAFLLEQLVYLENERDLSNL